MKVLIVGPGFPLRGGIANFNLALARAFIQLGYACEIVSFSLQYPKILFPGKTQFESGQIPEDVEITPLINSIDPLNWNRVVKYIEQKSPDLLIPVFWLPFTGFSVGRIVKKLKSSNIPTIALIHNVFPHDKKPGDYMLSKQFFKNCDAFVALSSAVSKDIETFVKNPVCKVIPHPVYDIFGNAVDQKEAIHKLSLSPDYKYILFFGLVKKYKGLDTLLNALDNPVLSRLKLKLIVAGEFYEDRNYYDNLIAKLKIRDKVIVLDQYIPTETVKYFFSACDLVIQPYKTATQSGVTQIAYHFDKPMIVTNVGGLEEMVPHNKVGFVVDKNSPEQIANAINIFFTEEKSSYFIKNIKQEKLRFSWENMAKGFLSLLEKIR